MAFTLVSVVLFLVATAFAADSKVNVTVYYESLCPDSQKFIVKQLAPTYAGPLATYMNLELIPYGKATTIKNGTSYNFTCQHGPVECYGNKIQACALKHITSMDVQVKFISCVMMEAMENKPKTDEEYPTKKCAEKYQLSADDLTKCANETEGAELLARLGTQTENLNPKLTSVPTIVYNGKMDKKSDDNSMKNFMEEFCHHIEGNKPHECQSGNNTAPAVFGSFVLMTSTIILTRIH